MLMKTFAFLALVTGLAVCAIAQQQDFGSYVAVCDTASTNVTFVNYPHANCLGAPSNFTTQLGHCETELGKWILLALTYLTFSFVDFASLLSPATLLGYFFSLVIYPVVFSWNSTCNADVIQYFNYVGTSCSGRYGKLLDCFAHINAHIYARRYILPVVMKIYDPLFLSIYMSTLSSSSVKTRTYKTNNCYNCNNKECKD